MGPWRAAEGEQPALAQQFAPVPEEVVVGVEHRHPLGGQAAEDLALAPGHSGQVAEALQMGGAGVGDDGHVGAGDMGQVADFTGMVGPHLDHRVVV